LSNVPFRFASELKNWSIEDSLDRVTVPVFLINGRADKVTDYMVEPLFFGLPHVRWITMDGSSHMPFWEERTRFMELVDQWLRVE
jgi:pimeloyl-ACP methyl ester carboxylesterase